MSEGAWRHGVAPRVVRDDFRMRTTRLEQALDWAVNSMSAPPERYLVCGPPGLLEVVHSCLRARGIPELHVDQERFASPELDEGFEDEAQNTVTFRTEDGELVGQGPASVTILRRGLDVGVAMPFSCTMGGCGACKVRLVEGAVSMEMPNCLTEEERAAGEVLACVARATGPCVVEVLR